MRFCQTSDGTATIYTKPLCADESELVGVFFHSNVDEYTLPVEDEKGRRITVISSVGSLPHSQEFSRYHAKKIIVGGRYVRLISSGGGGFRYSFCEEIEVATSCHIVLGLRSFSLEKPAKKITIASSSVSCEPDVFWMDNLGELDLTKSNFVNIAPGFLSSLCVNRIVMPAYPSKELLDECAERVKRLCVNEICW